MNTKELHFVSPKEALGTPTQVKSILLCCEHLHVRIRALSCLDRKTNKRLDHFIVHCNRSVLRLILIQLN